MTVQDTTVPVITAPTAVVVTAVVTAVELAALTPAQLALLTPVQLASLTPIQAASLTPAQVASLAPTERNVVNRLNGTCGASAPSVTASLLTYSEGDDGHDSDEGRFIIQFSGSGGGTSLALSAELVIAGYDGSISVSNGQMIEFEYENEKTEVEIEEGKLEIEAPSMVLRVTARDECDNSASAEAYPEGLSGDNDDDYDHRDDHDD
ncbi:MAG: hypothetical protein Q9O24_01585 [Gammaproteobacteria bacterium]|nr:hypothetical protein [Gammaproteobacteria bacterium]